MSTTTGAPAWVSASHWRRMFFEVNDDGELELKADSVPDGQLADVEAAVDGCPTEALSIEDG